jgi:hypothetical protein
MRSWARIEGIGSLLHTHMKGVVRKVVHIMWTMTYLLKGQLVGLR